MPIEIILPAGTERVTVREIPELFATAIIPEVPEGAPRQVIELKKMPMTEDNKRQWCGEGTRAFPVRLTAEDMKMLWAGMPPLRLPIDVDKWQPYADAFALAGIVDWELRAPPEDPALARLIVFADAVEKRKKGVRDAVQSGVLTPRSPRTFMPDPEAIGETLQDAFVTVENLREYAARDGIIVSVQSDAAHSGTTEKAAPDVAQDGDQQGELLTEPQQKAGEPPAGIPKKEVLSVDWPLYGRFKQVSLIAALSDVPDWLKPARTAPGSPGKASALWNPASLAYCLLAQGHANEKALRFFLGRHFAESLPEWEKLQEYR